jgi:hypothetical protein
MVKDTLRLYLLFYGNQVKTANMALLGKLTFIQSYDADNTDYPILGILCDPRAPGYAVPADLAPHPDDVNWPNHVFHGAAPAENDGRVMWSYSIFPGPWVTSTRIDRDSKIVTVKRRRNIKANIASSETVSSGVLIRNFYEQENDDLIATEINETRDLPGTEMIRAEVDGETGTEVTVTMQMIAKPTLPFTQVAGSEITYQPISAVHGMKVTTTLSSFAALSVVDYPTGKMKAPALITNAVLNSTTARDGTPALSIVWTKRASMTREVKMTRTKTFGTQSNMLAAQAALTLENPGTIDLVRDPWFIPAIRESDVLTNAVTLGPYTTGTENPKWPYIVESVSWGNTSPTASAYPGRTGVVLSAVVEYWKYNLWRLTKIQADTF